MKFSVVMASRMVPYAGCAKDREGKLLRAIQSVYNQTFTSWELHIVSDGCQRTIDIVKDSVEGTNTHLWSIEHTKLWSGRPRNTGIDNAAGEYIIYLDNDDFYGARHLELVNDRIDSLDWAWYNDYRYHPKSGGWFENDCDIHVLGRHGTSNVCHKTSLGLRWDEDGRYAHDYVFCQKLLAYKNGGRISTPEYFVAHIPGVYDL